MDTVRHYSAPWLKAAREPTSADSLLKRFGAWRVPVPIFDLAEALGVELFEDDMEDCDGKLEVGMVPPWARITVQSDVSLNRQRFTVGHELGHLVLHTRHTIRKRLSYKKWNRARLNQMREEFSRKADLTFKDQGFGGGLREAQANGYAAALLMPLDLLGLYAPAADYDVHVLAYEFQVSPRAMDIRLQRLAGGSPKPYPWG